MKPFSIDPQIDLHDPEARKKLIASLKAYIEAYRSTLPDRFAQSGGKDFLLSHTRFIDMLIKSIYRIALFESFGEYLPPKNNLPLSLFALGSYGREQLCVYSDIDILFLYEEVEGYNVSKLIESMLYLLWDCGIKLGHRVHTLNEIEAVAASDITIKSALIEARFIEGSHILRTRFQNALGYIRKEKQIAYIKAKLEERDQKHRRYPITMEPHLKEGTGGFRDANLVFWIGNILYGVPRIKDLGEAIVKEEEYRPFRIALEFLFRVRSALHLVSGKKEDRLRLEYIPDICRTMGFEEGYASQRKLATKVFASMRTIKLFTDIWIERLTQSAGFSYNHFYCHDNGTLTEQLHTVLRGVERGETVSASCKGALYMLALQKASSERLSMLVLDALRGHHAADFFRVLYEARILDRVIPVFRHVIDLPQFDGYHHYTVDLHSLYCLASLEQCDDAHLNALWQSLDTERQTLLKLVTLLHDVGKGRKEDHHKVGVRLFKTYARRLGFQKALIEEGAQLVRYHTYMSKVAQREDIYNERIIFAFLSRFPNETMLKMIYLLTYADLSGVGKGIYNSHNAGLLRTLYHNALEKLHEKHHIDDAAKRLKKEAQIRRKAQFASLDKSLQKKILKIPSTLLFVRESADEILRIAEWAQGCDAYRFHIDNERYLQIEVVRNASHPFDLATLLYRLERLNVTQMDIYKLFDEKKYFKITFNDRVSEDDIPSIEAILHETLQTNAPIPLPALALSKEQIGIECDYSETTAAMTLRCKDQKGLLASVVSVFDSYGIDIVSAKIHTLKREVRDLFLIEKNGNFCHNSETIIKTLTQREENQCAAS